MNILDILNEIEAAYPEDIFPDTTQEERDPVIKQHPGLIDRVSAGMGRHLVKLIREKLKDRETNLDGYCNCEFPKRRSFIESGRFNGEHEVGRHNVSICLNCGRIHVHTYKNGQHFSVAFHIVLPQQVAAIQRYIDYLEEAE